MITYEVYVDGGLSSDDIYFHRKDYFHGAIPAGVQKTSGGVLVTTYPYEHMTSPNVWPDHRIAGQLGLTSILTGGVPDRCIDYAFAWADNQLDLSAPTNFPNRLDIPNEMKIRYFLRKFTVAPKWTDGTTDVPLVGRWIGIGGPEYSFQYYSKFYPEDVSNVNSFRGYNINGYTFASDSYFDNRPTTFGYTLTDNSGIATYYCLLGIAIGKGDNRGNFVWELAAPSAWPGFGTEGPTQNVSLYTNQNEHHQTPMAPSFNKAYNVDEAHTFRQWSLTTNLEKTSGWGIDYTTAWNPTTGMLSCPAPSLAVFKYHQGVTIYAIDDVGVSHPANVTLASGGGVGPYTGVAGSVINTLPKGSTFKDVRIQPGDDPSTLPPLNSIPLVSATPYPNATGIGEYAEIILPDNDPLFQVDVVPACLQGLGLHTIWTGKAGNTLTGVSFVISLLTPTWPIPNRNYFEGGEVLTEAYDYSWTATDGSGKSGSGKVWIHEECYQVVDKSVITGVEGIPVLVIDKIGTRLVSILRDTELYLYRQKGAEADYTHFDVGVSAAEPWIDKNEQDSTFPIYIVFRQGSTIYLLRNRDGGSGAWKMAIIGTGTSPVVKVDTARKRINITYCQGGDAYITMSQDEFVTIMPGFPVKILTGIPDQHVTFDWLDDDKHSYYAVYQDAGGHFQSIKSSDNGHTWA